MLKLGPTLRYFFTVLLRIFYMRIFFPFFVLNSFIISLKTLSFILDSMSYSVYLMQGRGSLLVIEREIFIESK